LNAAGVILFAKRQVRDLPRERSAYCVSAKQISAKKPERRIRVEQIDDDADKRELARVKRLARTGDNQLLYSREQVCHLLGGIHKATLIRHEAAGRLHPVKLNPGKLTAKTYYRRDEVFALVDELTSRANAGD
jgi:hypothetical protein